MAPDAGKRSLVPCGAHPMHLGNVRRFVTKIGEPGGPAPAVGRIDAPAQTAPAAFSRSTSFAA